MTTIKLHNVFHDEIENTPNNIDIEQRIESYILRDDIKNVRVAPGNQNSPLFIEIESEITLNTCKSILRQALTAFNKEMNRTVEIEKAIKDRNIRIIP